MRPDAWADGADALLRAVLAEIERCDPGEHGRILHALENGGRLKLVMDCPERVWRLRVRLVHPPESDQANGWIWESYARRVPWQPLALVS